MTGTEPVVDPMCGSGTFVIEAAEIAAGLLPGAQSRSFAFETLASFDADAWEAMRGACRADAHRRAFLRLGPGCRRHPHEPRQRRAGRGVGPGPISPATPRESRAARRPAGAGDREPALWRADRQQEAALSALRDLGQTLLARFKGWRVGLVTSEPPLAKATACRGSRRAPAIAHGGMKVWFWQTPPLR